RYARWCERTAANHRLLLDFKMSKRAPIFQAKPAVLTNSVADVLYNKSMLYIDIYFLINWTMDMILIILTGHVRRNKPSVFRYCAASFCGAVWSVVPVMAPNIPEWLFAPVSYIGICALMCRIAYPVKGVRQILWAIFVLYLTTWGMGGTLNFLYFRTKAGVWLRYALYGEYAVPGIWWLLICAAIVGGVWILAWNWYQYVNGSRKIIYPVEIQVGEKRIEAKALIDTGNRLYTPGGNPVSIMDHGLAEEWLGGQEIKRMDYRLEGGIPYILIPYQSIGKELGFMAVIKADRMVIHKDTSDETVAAPAIGISELCFSRGKEYQVILHSAMGR
ncbi:MAG: sigma-E processing peptidase SpoIIGA, partial [Lachnospiraceae bacterium]